MQSFIDRLYLSGHRNPILLSLSFDCADIQELQVKAGADFGTLLLNGYGNAVEIVAPSFSADDIHRVALGILQATRLRISKTEYIACPGCGRTLFDLQTTLREVREATSHLKGLKIGVMGCIVNGPGEMADADYGYVGAGIGKVSLYKGKELIYKNIPREEALPALIALIKSCGDWHD
jgi:(E)-4-hydroxy-3-methylbut-2-enyl-diphosphate synthase